MTMNQHPTRFALRSRILHWLMAAMLLTMLFIGVAMVASLGNYHQLVALHRPLGITILILAIIRLINRKFSTLPPFPPTMSSLERLAASWSERLLYTLMILLPLVGWSMLSAGHYPITMFGPVHLPPILPASPALFAFLRGAHTVLAYLLFLTFLAHLGAVLFHTLIIRDRLLARMALWPVHTEKETPSRNEAEASNLVMNTTTMKPQHSTTAASMQTRQLGNSDLHITPIGFGAWAVGGPWKFGWGSQDDTASIAAIHRALELGVNWIDTAAIYGLGHSEEVVAGALREWKGKRPYVFTKCGMIWNEQREVGYSLRAESVRRECEASLRRLQVDIIDLYQVHWPMDDLAETEEGWTTLAALQKEGKLRWIGVSNFSVAELEKVSAIAPVTSLQPPYSLVKRDIEQGQLPWCAEHGVGVIVYSPMASGLLTGAMTRERIAALPADDWRRQSAEFQQPKLTSNLALVERLRAVAKRHGRTAGEAAIAWTLRQPAVTAAIVGGRSPQQVEGIIGAADWRLTNDEILDIEHSN